MATEKSISRKHGKNFVKALAKISKRAAYRAARKRAGKSTG